MKKLTVYFFFLPDLIYNSLSCCANSSSDCLLSPCLPHSHTHKLSLRAGTHNKQIVLTYRP